MAIDHEAPMTFEAFNELLANDFDGFYRQLIDNRGGCSCHISPPCSNCSNPLTEEEAQNLGWTPLDTTEG